MDIVVLPSSPYLGKRIAEMFGLKIARAEYKRFPDGELYVRIESKEDKHILVGSITKNEDLIFVNLALDALDGEKIAVIPYMGYARQDRKFLEGEAVSIRAVAKAIESYAEKIFTVNIHSEKAKEVFKKLFEVDAMPTIGEYYKDKEVIMVSPDRGSVERVKKAASFANCEWDFLEKRRIDANTVEISPKEIDVEGKKVVIVDDIISTGGTIVEAAKRLYELGAKEVEACCVHAVLTEFAAVKITSSGIEITSTDTIERIFSRISVAKPLANSLKPFL